MEFHCSTYTLWCSHPHWNQGARFHCVCVCVKRVESKDMQHVQLHRALYSEGPCTRHHLEILNLWTRGPHFHFALSPANHVTSPSIGTEKGTCEQRPRKGLTEKSLLTSEEPEVDEGVSYALWLIWWTSTQASALRAEVTSSRKANINALAITAPAWFSLGTLQIPVIYSGYIVDICIEHLSPW